MYYQQIILLRANHLRLIQLEQGHQCVYVLL